MLGPLLLFGLSSVLTRETLGQCSTVTGPTALTCAGCTNPVTNPAKGFTTVAPYIGLYRNPAGADRLLVPMTWGWVLYSLASPALPSEIRLYDLRYAPAGPGFPHQDGQSYGPGYFVSSDGQRVVNSLALSTGETVISIPNPAGEASSSPFLPKGDTGLQNAKVAVQKRGNRYIVYGLTTRNFFAADITNLTKFDQANPIPSDRSFSLGSTGGSLGLADGGTKQFLFSFDSSGAIVVDISNPGAAPNIMSGFVKISIPKSVFGLPGQALRGVTAAVDPASGKLYVLGSFVDNPAAQAPIPSFGLVLYDSATSQATLIGTYTTPFEANAPSFNSEGSPNGGAMTVDPSGDVWAFMWVRSASLGRYRLYASPVKKFGTPITQSADVSGPTGSITGTSFLFKSPSDVYAYFLDGTGPWATRLNCQAGPVAATGHLGVENVFTGLSVASGDTVFVGDALQIGPSVTPSNVVQPVTAWNLDFDYHAATETGTIGVMQLSYPDACLVGCSNSFGDNSDPPAFTFIGPCNPRTGGNPSTGTGCWDSVATPDFSSPQPPAGMTRALPIAFEASNALNTTTVPLAQFNVVWKVPAVTVQNLSALLNNGSAAFADASEGHPVSAGYKWYFGSNASAPASETLTKDASCTGPSCTHHFSNGKGIYNAWLTASYRNGYVSPDCANPCGGAAGAFRVTVTDFVPAFTAPSAALVYNTMSITNNSQIGAGVTGTSYAYNLCDASSGSCTDSGNYQPIIGMGGPGTTGTFTAPSEGGTWWLRIRATYNAGSTAQWRPGASGVSDPTAWPVTVTAPKPLITPISGFGYCSLAGCPSPYTGETGTPVTLVLTQSGSTLSGNYSWSVSGAGANPVSGSGDSFSFTPNFTGSAVVSVTAGYYPLPDPIIFAIQTNSVPVATRFYTVAPCRQLDTRSGAPMDSHGTLTVAITGAPCGIPAGAKSVSVNIAETQAGGQGHLRIYPTDEAMPGISSLNFNVGQTRSNNAILILSNDGTGSVAVYNASGGTVHVIIDVNGYFQ